ncbi:MAG TPA: RNA polymerase sigma factor [Solirubrobacteraceae bacterium]|nr:RNA polymerase sigma factor [Solirubrobacteraceae bacterium]
MEASALSHGRDVSALRGPSPLLRLQSDERLIALTRRGQHAAFEALCARYQARLLSFVRHMLGSREDAEDVLQEVFAAAFNAVLADERPINVRPWLYRIARNRSLNHLRRASAVGMDSMDVHFADHGLSTADRVLRRESFRELLADVGQLPETQRTALLLREIDALSYEQIAHAMETTVPSVKSLLVRARISLAEAAEARKLSCDEVRLELGEVAEGLIKLSAPARRHVRDCTRCRSFKRQLRANNQVMAAIFPIAPLLVLKKLVLAKLGSASSAHVASGASATVGAGAAASAAGTAGAGAGGVFTVGAGAIASKAVAGLAAAAIVSAGAVAANQTAPHRHPVHAKTAYVPQVRRDYEPVVAEQRAQPLSVSVYRTHAIVSRHAAKRAASLKPAAALAAKPPATPPAATATAPLPATPAAALPAKPGTGEPPGGPSTQLTTEATQLPASATTTPAASPPLTPGQVPPAEQAPASAAPATSTGTASQPAPPAAAPSGPAMAPATTTAAQPQGAPQAGGQVTAGQPAAAPLAQTHSAAAPSHHAATHKASKPLRHTLGAATSPGRHGRTPASRRRHGAG